MNQNTNMPQYPEAPHRSSTHYSVDDQPVPTSQPKAKFPYFHVIALVVIAGAGCWLWSGGYFAQGAKKTATQAPAEDESPTIQTSAVPDTQTIELATSPEATQVANQLEEAPAVVQPQVDPATLLFGVVSRIRGSREEP